jgi:hypothetical protein
LARPYAGSVEKIAGVENDEDFGMPGQGGPHATTQENQTRRKPALPRAKCRAMLELLLCSLPTHETRAGCSGV